MSSLAVDWGNDAIQKLFSFVWDAHASLSSEILSRIDWTGDIFDIERSITEILEPRIHSLMTGDEPVYVQHGSHERETAYRSNAQPPVYDIAFVLRADEKIKLPLEAKVVRSDTHLANYILDIQESYRSCRYAPFSCEGAMIAYLLAGDPIVFLKNVREKLRRNLSLEGAVPNKHHQTSLHSRKVPLGKNYPKRFRCHHLVMLMIEPPSVNN